MAEEQLPDVLAWDCDLTVPRSEYERMAGHPGLEAGIRALASGVLAATEADRTLLGIFKDAGRYVSAMWAIYLHVSGGLSLQSLKALCAQSGLLSPGRARALLLYMRYLGYVEPVRESRSPALYVPTARFRAAWTLHMRLVLEAACAIEPAARAVVDRIDDPDIFVAIVRTQGESLFNGTQSNNIVDTPLFRVFLNRHAGTLVLAGLMTAGGDGDGYPPRLVTAPAASDLAQRYQVSRIQVRRLFAAAEKEGLLTREGDNWRLQETFRDAARTSYTEQLRHLLLSAARAARVLSAIEAGQF